MKRFKQVDPDPNPLFMKWLNEFREEAKEKANLPLVKIYNMCIDSLGKYPLPLPSGKHCMLLSGFGKTICARLDKNLEEQMKEDAESEVEHVQSPLSPLKNISADSLDRNCNEVQGGSAASGQGCSSWSPRPKQTLTNGRREDEDDEDDDQLKLALQLSQIEYEKENRKRKYSGDDSLAKIQKKDHNGGERRRKEVPLSKVFSENEEDEGLEVEGEIHWNKEKTQEEEDLELALNLSQQEQENLHTTQLSNKSQEESDLEFARRLQEELNGEIGADDPDKFDLPSPQGSPRESYHCKQQELLPGIMNEQSSKEIYGPENPTVKTHTKESNRVVQSSAISQLLENDPVFNRARVGRGKKNSSNKTKIKNTDFTVLTDQSVNLSDDPVLDRRAEQSRNKPSDVSSSVVSRLLANDPVFNGKGGSKRGKPKKNQSLAVEMGVDGPEGEEEGGSRKGRKSTKEYVPKYRSGAYAVLITLYKKSQMDDYTGYMTKDDLQRAAQPLSDQSFALKNAHSEFYTAWSSVSTLVKHSLVSKWSNPCKYNITDKGLEMAARILTVETSSQVAVVPNLQTVNRLSSTQTSGALEAEARDAIASRAGEREGARLSSGNFSLNLDDISFSDSFNIPEDPPEPIISTQTRTNPSHPPGPSRAATAPLASRDNLVQAINCNGVGSGRYLTDLPDHQLTPALLLQKNMGRAEELGQAAGSDRNQPQFILAPGTFDILLCVDNTEVTGGAAGGRKNLKQETVRHLEACHAAYDRRNLNIGDFLWIAREKVEIVPGQFHQRAPKELVLPYIVERKRLDDLWSSVKDGRYEEQKFRMKSSGLANLFYLVEDFSAQKNWGQAQKGTVAYNESIHQAISNTAVQEGFTVVKTRDQRGTIEYLTLFTRILANKYSRLTLRSCTLDDITEGRVQDREVNLLNFQELNSTSRKNRRMTLKEIFAKMLLRLKGLSVDMAQGIVEEFKTPRQFREALLGCDSKAEQVNLIQGIIFGLQSKRKIPRPLAEALATFWTMVDLS